MGGRVADRRALGDLVRRAVGGGVWREQKEVGFFFFFFFARNISTKKRQSAAARMCEARCRQERHRQRKEAVRGI